MEDAGERPCCSEQARCRRRRRAQPILADEEMQLETCRPSARGQPSIAARGRRMDSSAHRAISALIRAFSADFQNRKVPCRQALSAERHIDFFCHITRSHDNSSGQPSSDPHTAKRREFMYDCLRLTKYIHHRDTSPLETPLSHLSGKSTSFPTISRHKLEIQITGEFNPFIKFEYDPNHYSTYSPSF